MGRVGTDAALAGGGRLRAVILVEGMSDRHALEVLAARHGRRLEEEGVAIVSTSGATNIAGFLAHYGPQGLGVRLAGLCDAGEERYVRRGLERAGLGVDVSAQDMEALGFYLCVDDLEDELIRAHGAASVQHVIEAHGELASFRTLQHQPAQRARSTEEQLRRFMGTRSGRKSRYARWLVETLDLDRIPRPLEDVLAHHR